MVFSGIIPAKSLFLLPAGTRFTLPGNLVAIFRPLAGLWPGIFFLANSWLFLAIFMDILAGFKPGKKFPALSWPLAGQWPADSWEMAGKKPEWPLPGSINREIARNYLIIAGILLAGTAGSVVYHPSLIQSPIERLQRLITSSNFKKAVISL